MYFSFFLENIYVCWKIYKRIISKNIYNEIKEIKNYIILNILILINIKICMEKKYKNIVTWMKNQSFKNIIINDINNDKNNFQWTFRFLKIKYFH